MTALVDTLVLDAPFSWSSLEMTSDTDLLRPEERGTPAAHVAAARLILRVVTKVDIDDKGCWRWTAATNHAGYGVLGFKDRPRLAHRVVYRLVHGSIPDGYHVDHLCRVTDCVNPDHLEAVTPAENNRRQRHANQNTDKTHCKRGHPFSGYNLIVRNSGARQCRKCLNMRSKRYKERKRNERLGKG